MRHWSSATHRNDFVMVTTIVVVSGILPPAASTSATPPGWRLVWSDDFDALDEQKWQRRRSFQPTSNAKQAYLPEQVAVSDGMLVILSENQAADGLPYRSGQVISERAQRLGRWEVRAKIPTGRGLRSTIRLLPEPSSSSQYKIDIMENRGQRPTITASACRWGPGTPSSPERIVIEQQTSLAGKLVSYPEGFHTYAVEWLDDQLRFYVDDVYHGILYSDEVGNFFSRHTEPMTLAIGTAIGGDSLPPPDDTADWPQRFLIDWVRVYEPSVMPAAVIFQNGNFEANGGTLAGWHVFGSRVNGDPNVLAHREAVKDGKASLKLSGQQSGSISHSGVSQGISISGGQRVRAKLNAFVRSTDSIAKTDNHATMKIEFYKRFGDYFGGPAMLGFEERVIADGSSPNDVWHDHELVAKAPSGTIEARFSIVFAQPNNEPGAVHIDGVEVAPIEN